MFQRIGHGIDVALAAFWGWYSKLFWVPQICLALLATSIITAGVTISTDNPTAQLICQINLLGGFLLPIAYLTVGFLRKIAAWVGWQMDHPKHEWGMPLCMLGFFGLLWEMTDEATMRQVVYWYGTCFSLILTGWVINRISFRKSNVIVVRNYEIR
ncbi:MAG: hypothetical protein HUU49_00500 [Candidatus Buchananbacteria bacterium]|nr:hypothetical protein [Candidatus Buchananbacteria bacterium]